MAWLFSIKKSILQIFSANAKNIRKSEVFGNNRIVSCNYNQCKTQVRDNLIREALEVKNEKEKMSLLTRLMFPCRPEQFDNTWKVLWKVIKLGVRTVWSMSLNIPFLLFWRLPLVFCDQRSITSNLMTIRTRLSRNNSLLWCFQRDEALYVPRNKVTLSRSLCSINW